ncbi:MAG TPA: hypothetical protein VNV44_08440 [Solirubrobacteraceae bacterium]|jgi:hypothetical protein|nr:hypothetical protein [Solirubrobacteraceae bacterium]
MRPSPLRPRMLAVAVAVTASLALLACGGSSSPSSSPVRAAAAERAAEQTSEVKFQDFARCLREHGIQAEAGTHGIKVDGGSEAAMHAAEKACARFRPPAQSGPNRMSAQERVAIEEKLQRFAKCMREHGVQVEVSAPGGRPQMNIHATPGGSGPNPESPAFKAAQKTCSKLLPVGPGGGPSPAGGS